MDAEPALPRSSTGARFRLWELQPASGLGGALAASGCAAGAPWHPCASAADALAAGRLAGGEGGASPEAAVAAVSAALRCKWAWRGAYCDFQRLPRFVELEAAPPATPGLSEDEP